MTNVNIKMDVKLASMGDRLIIIIPKNIRHLFQKGDVFKLNISKNEITLD